MWLNLLFSRWEFFIYPSKHPPSLFSQYCPGVRPGRWKEGYEVDGHQQKLVTVIKISSRYPVVLTFCSLKVSLERWGKEKNVPLVPTEFSSLVSHKLEWQSKDDPRPLLLLEKGISIRMFLHTLAQKPSLCLCSLLLHPKPIPIKVRTGLKITQRIISPTSTALPFLNRRNNFSYLLVISLCISTGRRCKNLELSY